MAQRASPVLGTPLRHSCKQEWSSADSLLRVGKGLGFLSRNFQNRNYRQQAVTPWESLYLNTLAPEIEFLSMFIS
jgi:hypothetical protein